MIQGEAEAEVEAVDQLVQAVAQETRDMPAAAPVMQHSNNIIQMEETQ